MNLKEYKELFFRSEKLHLNNAGLSPIMKPAQEEINFWAKRFFEEGYYSDHDYMARVDWTRQQISKLVDCGKDEIAFFQSCAGGISQFAFGIDLKKDDEIILFDQEYSSNLYPWQQACKRAEAQLVVVDLDVVKLVTAEMLIAKITKKTKVIAVSAVQYQMGAMIDLEKVSAACQQNGVLLFVDAMQSLGMHTLSFKKLKIDGLVCGSHKWLNGPVGVAFLVLKKELIQKIQPLSIGSGTYGTCDDPSDFACEPKVDASKFEAGSKQVLEICALGRSIEVTMQIGVDSLRAEAFSLAEHLRYEIKRLNFKVFAYAEQPNQFVNFSTEKGNKELQKFLFNHGVHVPLRGPGVRVTPHAFNTAEDIDKFITILRSF